MSKLKGILTGDWRNYLDEGLVHEVDVWDVERAYLVWEIEVKRHPFLDCDQHFGLMERMSLTIFLLCQRLRSFEQDDLDGLVKRVSKHMVFYDLHPDNLSVFGMSYPAQLS